MSMRTLKREAGSCGVFLCQHLSVGCVRIYIRARMSLSVGREGVHMNRQEEITQQVGERLSFISN